jgi:hypothetical protein
VTVYCKPRESAKRDLYVLAIGVCDYSENALDLLAAWKDAQDLSRTLETNATAEFDAVHIKTVLDREATKENILSVKISPRFRSR